MPISIGAIAVSASVDMDNRHLAPVFFGFLTNGRKSVLWLPEKFMIEDDVIDSTMGCSWGVFSAFMHNNEYAKGKRFLNPLELQDYEEQFAKFMRESTKRIVTERVQAATEHRRGEPIAGDIINALAVPQITTSYEAQSWSLCTDKENYNKLEANAPGRLAIGVNGCPWFLIPGDLISGRPKPWERAEASLKANLFGLAPEQTFDPNVIWES